MNRKPARVVVLVTALALLALAPSAHAVSSGKWKGGDIEFKVSM